MYNIDYLLSFISNTTLAKIKSREDYILELLTNNKTAVSLNIKYLIKYGISNIDEVVYNFLDEIIMEHNDFIKLIESYEKRLGYDNTILMLENL